VVKFCCIGFIEMNKGGSEIYRFAGIELDPARHTIKRNGHELHLRQRSFEVLLYLIENRDRAVSKEELFDKLWQVSAVSDDALVQSIVEIRKAVGEDSRTAKIIKTIPKTGYRFVAALEQTTQSITEVKVVEAVHFPLEKQTPPTIPATPSANEILVRTRKFPALLFLLLILLAGISIYFATRFLIPESAVTTLPNKPGSKSVAVLFFDNQTKDSDLNWLREGLPDMIITGLSHSRQLNLLSRQHLHLILERMGHNPNEAIRFDDAMKIAERVKAETFVLGSFSRIGEQIRIDIQLYDSKKGQMLAADHLLLEKPDAILSNVDLLSLKIASHLGVMPSSTGRTTDLSDVMTNNLDAYRYYSLAVEKALGLHNQEAIVLLEKAIAIDPNFAMAHARIGFAYAVTSNYPEQAKPHLQKAFQLSDHLTDKDRLYISGWYAIANEDYPSAIRYFRRLIHQYPFEVEAYIRLGRLLVSDGRFQEGLDCYRQGLLVDPDSPELYNELGGVYGAQGKISEAIQMHQMYVKFAPSEPNAHDSLAMTYQSAGEYSHAIEEYSRALSLDPEFEVAVVHLGNVYFQMGRYNDAIRQFKRYIEVTTSERDKKRGTAAIAYVYWKKHDLEQAAKTVSLNSTHPTEVPETLLILSDFGDSRAANLKDRLQSILDPGRGHQVESRIYHFPLGYYLLKTGKTAEAIQHFQQGLEQNSPNWNIDTFEDCLANAYLQTERYDEAIAEYNRILEKNPNYPLAHFHRAKAYEAKGAFTEARNDYQQFLRVWKNADSDIPEVIEAKEKKDGETRSL